MRARKSAWLNVGLHTSFLLAHVLSMLECTLSFLLILTFYENLLWRIRRSPKTH